MNAPRFTAAGADLSRVHFAYGVIDPVSGGEISGPVVLPDELDALSITVRENDIAMVWIDSLVTTLPDGIKTISYRDVSRALRPLREFAEQEGIAVVAPWHLNKTNSKDPATRMMDSRGFRTAARSVLFAVRAEPIEEGAVEGVIALDKANAGPTQVPALRYRIGSAPYTVEEDGHTLEASCGVAEWLGPEDESGWDIIRAGSRPASHSRTQEIDEWLDKYLRAHGETERQQVLRDGVLLTFSDSAIKRSAKRLAIHSREETGQDPESGSPWRKAYWSVASQVSGPDTRL